MLQYQLYELCETNSQHLKSGSEENASPNLSFEEKIKYFCFLERVILYFVFY